MPSSSKRPTAAASRRPMMPLTLVLLTIAMMQVQAVRSMSTGSAAGNQTAGGELELIILHNNDMHARFEQTGKYSNTCQMDDVLSNRCYGGFARVASKLKEYRDKAANGGTPVLYLNAGDTYTGTPWFTLYKDKIVAEFLNLLKPDAISLGNHEFDENVAGLVPFLEAAHFPVLVANMDTTDEPTLTRTKALKKSTIFNVNGIQVGVIGYLTPETKTLAADNKVRLTDEVVAINAEAAELKRQGVKILIALGHSGLTRDREIGAQCPDLDLVIGGHSHTFLYSGPTPDAETPAGPYPVMVKRADGSEVPVVQAYAFTKYLGFLHLNFNAAGKLVKFNGQPILLDNHVERDPSVLAVLERYRPGVLDMQASVVGVARVFMNGTCRFNECNLGNFIADGMVWQRARTHQGEHWTDAPIALLQGGGVRSSLSAGNVTMFDLTQLQPFGNALVVLEVNGSEILAALEHAVHRYDTTVGNGEYLQISGLRVTYNVSKPTLHRVQHVEALCAACEVPSYAPLDASGTYRIVVSEFMQTGGDGFGMLKKPIVDRLPGDEKNATESYLAQMRFVYPAIEGRIVMSGKSSGARVLLSWSALMVAVMVALFGGRW